MSKVIDQRVVEMKFDNQQFENNIKTSMSTLDRFKQALKFDNVKSGFAEIETASKGLKLDGISSAVETVKNRFSALEVAAITALANITNSAVNAGKQLIQSLTIAPIKQGYDEYELKMGAIKTIMASTGEDIGTVNKYLNELNKYADETIYSFSDMTQNIGKFTNAGVKLDDAVRAIQGISNEAAVSGANAEQASHAMYNFAQALSAGYVKLIDWKSIEVANMATLEFKQTLLDVGLALGTVVKEGDKYVTTTTNAKGEVSEAFTATRNFNESLNHQWMTTDVLVKTLGIYSKNVGKMTEAEKAAYRQELINMGIAEDRADALVALGEKAFSAAQDITKFTQLLDVMREAVGSGWAMTFELILGNLEEAKVLWGSVYEVVGGFIDRMSEARNAVLMVWKDAKIGGRSDLITALGNSFKYLFSIVRQVSAAFRDVFKPLQASQLIDLTKRFKAFSETLKLSDMDAGNLRATFRGLFASLDLAFQGFKILMTILSPVTTLFKYLVSGVLALTGWIGEMVYEFDRFIQRANPAVTIMNNLNRAMAFLVSSAQEARAFQALTTIYEKLCVAATELEARFNQLIADLEQSEEFGWLVQTFENLGGAIVYIVKNGIEYLIQGLEAIAAMDFTIPSLEEIYSYIGSVKDNVKGFFQLFKDVGPFQFFSEILDTVSSNFSSLVSTFTDEGSTLNQMLTKIGDAFKAAFGDSNELIQNASENFKKISGVAKTAMDNIKVEHILAAGGIAGIFAIYSKLRGFMKMFDKSQDRLIRSVEGLFVSFREVLEDYQKKIKAQALLDIAKAIGILALALIGLAMVPEEDLKRGGKALAALMASFVVVIKLMSGIASKLSGINAAQFLAMGAAILAISYAVKMLIEPIMRMRYIKWDYLKGGVSAVFWGMMSLAAAFATVSKMSSNLDAGKMLAVGAAFIELAFATQLLSMSILAMSQLSFTQLVKGLGTVVFSIMAMTSALAILGSALTKDTSPTKFLAIGAAFIELAAAMYVLSQSIQIIGGMGIRQVVKGLIGVTGGLIAMTFALGSLTAATKLLGVSGKQLLAVASSFVILAAAMAILTPSIVVLSLIPFTKLAQGLGAVMLGMMAMAAALTLVGKFAGAGGALAAGAGFVALAIALNMLVTPITALGLLPWDTVKQGLTALGLALAGITAAAILGGPAVLALGLGFLALGTSVTMTGLGVMLLANGLALLVPAILGLSMISETTLTNFMNAIDTLAERLMQLIPTIVNYIVSGFVELLTTLQENAGVINEALTAILVSIVAVFAAVIPSIIDFLGILLESVLKFIDEHAGSVIEMIIGVWKAMVTALKDHLSEFMDLGAGTLLAFWQGIRNNAQMLIDEGIKTVITLIDAMATGIDTNAEQFVAAFDRLVGSVINLLLQQGPHFFAQGAGFVEKIIGGVIKLKDFLFQTFLNIIGIALQKIGVPTEWIETGKKFIMGIIEGLEAGAKWLWDKVKSIGQGMLSALTDSLKEQSPSKATYQAGVYFDKGLENGINAYSGAVKNSAAKMGDDLLNTIQNTMDGVTDYMSGEYNPTISPVMDLSSISAGAGNINKLFENTKTQELAWQASADGNFNVMADLTRQLNSKFDGFSNEDVVTELTGLRGDMATMNERLGRMQVVMDTGTLVGALGPGMDNYLGNMSVLAGRGV